MGVTISENLLSQPGNILMQVRSATPADRVDGAMRKAAADIRALGGPNFVSDVFVLPDGPMIMVDPGDAEPGALPVMLSRRLTEAGVASGEITAPRRIGDRYLTIQSFGPAVRAWLRPPLAAPIGFAPRQTPAGLLDMVVQWTRAGWMPGAELMGVFVSAETRITWDAVPGLGGAAVDSGAAVAIVASDFSAAVTSGAVVNGFRGTVPEATLAAAPGSPEEMLALRALIRNRATEFAWAGVSVENDARDLLSPQWEDRESGNSPAVETLSDTLIPAAMWYQILTAGHIQRLGGPPAGAGELAGGLFELTVGEPEQWMPGHPDLMEVKAMARHLLAPCLVSSDEAFALRKQRMTEARERDQNGFFPRAR